MATSAPRQVATMNYLVPASGTTTGFVVDGVFTATPTVIDWRGIGLDGEPFTPSGVFMDNSQGAADLVVRVRETGHSFICPAGKRRNLQYPAPMDQTVEIVGDGQANIVFVNFPVLPTDDSEGGSTDMSGVISRLDTLITETGEIGTDVLEMKLTIGTTADAAWNGTDANATVISLLKALALNTSSIVVP